MNTEQDLVQASIEASRWLDQLVLTEFGTPIQIPVPEPMPKSDTLRDARLNEGFKAGPLLPFAANSSYLTTQIGKGFLICFYNVGENDFVRPGVITPMTTRDSIHFTYLDAPTPRDQDFKLSPLQKLILEGCCIMQDRRIGAEGSHENVPIIASEIGHIAMAIRSLSDPSVMADNRRGSHVVHSWSRSSTGIVPILTKRNGPKKPGVFDLPDNNGDRIIKVGGILLKRRDAECALVESAEFNPLKPKRYKNSANSAKVLLGFAIVGARLRLGDEADERLLRALHSI